MSLVPLAALLLLFAGCEDRPSLSRAQAVSNAYNLQLRDGLHWGDAIETVVPGPADDRGKSWWQMRYRPGPDGEVRMISEGLLRLVHRKVASVNPDGRALRTPRTYARADMQAMPIDEVQTLAFDFIPVSMLFQKGHCIRVAIVGHDKDQFKQYAEEGQVYTLERNVHHVSYLELPIEVHGVQITTNQETA